MKYKAYINLNNDNSNYTLALSGIKNSSRVLDVGCASGMIGEFLFNEKKCEVVGIEYDDNFIEKAREKKVYKDLFQIDLNNADNQFNPNYIGYFDYILLADVIEHVYSPEQTINSLKKLLKTDGVFIFSIPNISHGSIKLKLLNNKFEYTPMGLLDETHIRFFTIDNVISLMNKTGLEIKSLERVFEGFWKTAQIHDESDYSGAVLRYVKKDLESYSYQYIVIAKLSDSKELEIKNYQFKPISDLQKLRLKKYLKSTKLKFGKRIEKYFKKIRNKIFNARK